MNVNSSQKNSLLHFLVHVLPHRFQLSHLCTLPPCLFTEQEEDAKANSLFSSLQKLKTCYLSLRDIVTLTKLTNYIFPHQIIIITSLKVSKNPKHLSTNWGVLRIKCVGVQYKSLFTTNSMKAFYKFQYCSNFNRMSASNPAQ